MKRNIKENNGITLIALVITIIVLLILAGVTISSIVGNNGVLQKAGSAQQGNDKMEIIELIKIDVMNQQLENGVNLGTQLIKQSQLKEFMKRYGEVFGSGMDMVLTVTQEKAGKNVTDTISVSDVYTYDTFASEE